MVLTELAPDDCCWSDGLGLPCDRKYSVPLATPLVSVRFASATSMTSLSEFPSSFSLESQLGTPDSPGISRLT